MRLRDQDRKDELSRSEEQYEGFNQIYWNNDDDDLTMWWDRNFGWTFGFPFHVFR